MQKTFRAWDPSQRFLLPPSVDEFVPKKHLANFIRNLVVDELNLAAIYSSYKGDKGKPPTILR